MGKGRIQWERENGEMEKGSMQWVSEDEIIKGRMQWESENEIIKGKMQWEREDVMEK